MRLYTIAAKRSKLSHRITWCKSFTYIRSNVIGSNILLIMAIVLEIRHDQKFAKVLHKLHSATIAALMMLAPHASIHVHRDAAPATVTWQRVFVWSTVSYLSDTSPAGWSALAYPGPIKFNHGIRLLKRPVVRCRLPGSPVPNWSA